MATVRITWQTGLYLLRVRAGGHFEKDYSKKILAAKNILKTGYPPGPNFKITQAPLTVGVLVLNASAPFIFIFSLLMRGLVLGKHTGRFSAPRVYVSYPNSIGVEHLLERIHLATAR